MNNRGTPLLDVAKLAEIFGNAHSTLGPLLLRALARRAADPYPSRQWDARTQSNDEFLAPAGRVIEMLSVLCYQHEHVDDPAIELWNG